MGSHRVGHDWATKNTEGTRRVAKLINYLKYLKARGLKKKENVRIRSIG